MADLRPLARPKQGGGSGKPEPFPNVQTGGSAIQNPNSRGDHESLCLRQGAFDKMEFGLFF